MRISDWSSDVCSSDLRGRFLKAAAAIISGFLAQGFSALGSDLAGFNHGFDIALGQFVQFLNDLAALFDGNFRFLIEFAVYGRSEEHTSELQSLMRISYAVLCLKKKNKKDKNNQINTNTKN